MSGQALAVEFRPKDIPPLQFADDSVKMFVSGVIKSFDDPKTNPAHSLVTTKRHFFYNRLVNSVRVVNRFSMKFADYETASPIAELVTPHFESASAVLLLRDGSVVSLQANDMPDKSVKVAATTLATVANASALCVLQSQGTAHSTALPWASKQILIFSSANATSVSITRIIPSVDGSAAEKQETVAAGKWAAEVGRVVSCSGGPNGFVALVGAKSGSVQVVHEADLASGVLTRVLVPHNEVGAQAAFFIPRETGVTSDADPTLAPSSSSAASSVLLTAARGGHELRLWGIRGGGQIALLQTVTFSGDKSNGDRVVSVDPSGDIVFASSVGNAVGTIVACEPEADRSAFRRITEWALPEGAAAVSVAACPNKDAAQRYSIFVRSEKSLTRYTFDNRISGASNVTGSSESSAAAAAAAGGNNNNNRNVDVSSIDPAIVSSAAAGASGAGGASGAPADVHAAVQAAVNEASANHFQSTGRLTEATEKLFDNLEHNIGTVLGVLRIPGVRQKSHEIAAEWAQKMRRAIDEAARQAAARVGGNSNVGSPSSPAAAASSSSNGGGIAGFTPSLAQAFYNSFLENIHNASQTVVDHSLEQLLESAISKALDRSWNSIQDLLEKGGSPAAVPKPTALPSFQVFSDSIVKNQTQQNQAVKRQVDQNRRDLDMYERVDGTHVAAAEQYLSQLQAALRELDSAVTTAKSSPSVAAAAAAGQAVTPANEDEVFAKLIKLAKEGQWKQATTTVANGGSISLLTRFLKAAEVEPYSETVCSPAQMAASSFVHCLRMLARGVSSAPAVAMTARVALMKRMTVPYSLALSNAEEAKNSAFAAEEKFLLQAADDIEEVRRELKKLNGADRETTRAATLVSRALGAMINDSN